MILQLPQYPPQNVLNMTPTGLIRYCPIISSYTDVHVIYLLCFRESSNWLLLHFCQLLHFNFPASYCLTSPQQATKLMWVVAASIFKLSPPKLCRSVNWSAFCFFFPISNKHFSRSVQLWFFFFLNGNFSIDSYHKLLMTDLYNFIIDHIV